MVNVWKDKQVEQQNNIIITSRRYPPGITSTLAFDTQKRYELLGEISGKAKRGDTIIKSGYYNKEQVLHIIKQRQEELGKSTDELEELKSKLEIL